MLYVCIAVNETPSIISTALRILTENGLRNTPVRRGVLGLLLASRQAYSSSAMELALRADRITVYRTLRTLEDAGILHRIKDTSGVDKYALCGGDCSKEGHHHEHAHFYCTSCEQTACLPDVTVVQHPMPKGFHIEESHLTYTGTCSACS